MNFDRRGTSDGGFDGYDPNTPDIRENKYFRLETSVGTTLFLETDDKSLNEETILSSSAVKSAVQQTLYNDNVLDFGHPVSIEHASQRDNKPGNGIFIKL